MQRLFSVGTQSNPTGSSKGFIILFILKNLGICHFWCTSVDMIEGVAAGAFTEYLQNSSVMCEQNEGGTRCCTFKYKKVQHSQVKYRYSSTQGNVLCLHRWTWVLRLEANPAVPTGGDGPSQNPEHQIMYFSYKPTLQQFFWAHFLIF